MAVLIRKISKSPKSLNIRNLSKLSFDGIFPPIVTPFDKKENVFTEKLLHNLSIWDTKPFLGYTVLGSNGEFKYLSSNEKCEIVKTVKDYNREKTIIAGAGDESTKLTKDMISRLADSGADVALVYNPCFYRGSMGHAAYMKHFEEIANHSPIPIILYNVPANTQLDIPTRTVLLLAQHSNIIGLKDSSGNVVRIGEVVYRTKYLDFQVLAGSAGFMLPTYQVGAVGTIPALANVMGDEVCLLHNLIRQGKNNEALTLQQKLIAPNSAVTATFGVGGLKYAADGIGLFGGRPRSPTQPLLDDQKVKLKAIFSEVGVDL